jgi:hypothetical protein
VGGLARVGGEGGGGRGGGGVALHQRDTRREARLILLRTAMLDRLIKSPVGDGLYFGPKIIFLLRVSYLPVLLKGTVSPD